MSTDDYNTFSENNILETKAASNLMKGGRGPLCSGHYIMPTNEEYTVALPTTEKHICSPNHHDFFMRSTMAWHESYIKISIHYSLLEPLPTAHPNVSLKHYKHRIPKRVQCIFCYYNPSWWQDGNIWPWYADSEKYKITQWIRIWKLFSCTCLNSWHIKIYTM